MDDRTRRTEEQIAEEVFLRDKTPPFREQEIARPEPKTRAGRRLGPIFLTLLAVLVSLGVYRLTTTIRAPKDAARNPPQAAPQPVGAATIALGDIKVVVNALGTVTPLATVTVKTQVNGQLIEVAFKEGQTVKKGDFLAQIDPRPFQVAENQAQGLLIHDQGLLDQAKMDQARYEILVKQNSIARQQAEDQVYIVKQYEGSVRNDQAQIDAQKLNLVYAHIISPIDGRVGLRLVDAGNYVQTTDTGIAVLTQLHPISVIFTVPEDDLPQIMAQMRAGRTLEVRAYDRANINELAVGKVITLDNQIDTTTGTVKLRAEFANLDDQLFPNQFVNARLLIKTLNNVVTAPTAAIQRGAPGAFVYLIGADNTVSVRPIEIGPTDRDMVAVVKGLSPGDRVVVDGADRLRDGAAVYIPSADQSEGDGKGQGKAAVDAGAKPNEPSGRRGDRNRQKSGQ